MGSAAAYGAIAQYRQVRNHGNLEEADPHRLITMLLDGAIERITSASTYIRNGDLINKAACISKSLSIVEALRAGLDLKVGHELAQKLDSLYDYLGRRLLHANMANDSGALDEAANLIRVIKEGWEAIGTMVHQRASSAANR